LEADVREVLAIFHVEPEGNWAEVPDLPGFSAAGDTLAELHGLVAEGVALQLGEPIRIKVRFAQDAQAFGHFWWSWSSKEYVRVNNADQVVTEAMGTSTTHKLAVPVSRVSLVQPVGPVPAG
jgi:hypothetical protein